MASCARLRCQRIVPSPPKYLLTAEVLHPVAALVEGIINEHDVRVVGDFGGGANPILTLDQIGRLGLRYLVVDASAAELAKAPAGYETHALDLTRADRGVAGERFDLVISRFVAEHIEDPVAFHCAVWNALRPGGLAAHFFPTLPALPFVMNRLLGGRASRRLVERLQPGMRHDEGPLAKFPAYYRWCEGPTDRQQRRYASVGFEVLHYVVLVGHRYYERIPLLQRAADALSRRLVRHPRALFSTYAFVVLQRSPER